MAKKIKPEEMVETQENSSILVVIEWNGETPPPTFYNRMHSYGLYSRRKRMETPAQIEESGQSIYEWRANQTGKEKTDQHRGIVLQEGVIQCHSASMANTIKETAFQYGAKNVIVGNFITTALAMSEKDLDAFMAVETRISKRGPKAKVEEGRYTVTCFEKGRTYEVKSMSMPTNCPECGSVRNQVRLGRQVSFSFKCPVTSNLMSSANYYEMVGFWNRTRFHNSSFEIPMFYDDNKHEMPPQMDKNAIPDCITAFFNSEALMHEDLIADIKDNPKAFMNLLDLVYCASQKNKSERKIERVQVIGDYLQGDGENIYDMSVPATLDIIDVVAMDREYIKYM